MADADKRDLSRAEVEQVLLNAIAHEAKDGVTSRAKDLAVAYRLVHGGTQPGSAVVEGK